MDDYGAGGYDGGYGGGDGTGGGGFMATSPGTGGGRGGGNASTIEGRSTQYLTIKQIFNAQGPSPGSDGIIIDGREVSSARLVGKLVDVQHEASRTNVLIFDGTGSVQLTFYPESYGNSWLGIQPLLVDGVTVSAAISIKTGPNGPTLNNNTSIVITCNKLIPVTDDNEMTEHLLNVIFQHMYYTRGALAPSNAAGMGGMGAGMGGNNFSAYSVAAAAAISAAGGAADDRTSHLPPQQRTIYQLVKDLEIGAAETDGVSIDAIVAEASRHGINASAANAAIDALRSDGQLYNTMDETMLKTTG